MRREDDRAVRAAIEDCREALEGGVPFRAATALGSLLEAEESGVVRSTWRVAAGADAVHAFLTQHAGEIEREWHEDLAQLERMLEGGPVGTGEEALLILHRRSSLECAKRFVPTGPERLDSVDEAVRAALRSNRKLFASEARQRRRASLEKRLPGHWWWRP